MSEDVQAVAALIAFCLLMTLLNIKSGSSHWTGKIMEVASFCLLLAGLFALVWKMTEVVL